MLVAFAISLIFFADVAQLLKAIKMELPAWLEEVVVSTQQQKRRSPEVEKALCLFVESAELTVADRAPLAKLFEPAADFFQQLGVALLGPRPPEPFSLLESLVKHARMHVVLLQVHSVKDTQRVLPCLFRCALPDAPFVLWLAQATGEFWRLKPGSNGFNKLQRVWLEHAVESKQLYEPFEKIRAAYQKANESHCASPDLRRAFLLSGGYILDRPEVAALSVVRRDIAQPDRDRWDAIERRMKRQFDSKLAAVKAPSSKELDGIWAAVQPTMADPTAPLALGAAPSVAQTYVFLSCSAGV